jgi:hypothetical protein
MIMGAEILFLPLFMLFCDNLCAQYFNVRVDFMEYNQPEVGFSLEKMDNGNYLIFHSARPESGDNLGLGRTVLNPDGEVVNHLVHFNESGPTYTGHKNTGTKINGGFVASGSRSWFTPTLESLITLSKYDEMGELVWIKEYGDQIHQSIGRAATRQTDGTLACAGYMAQSASGGHGFLLLADSIGELLDIYLFGGQLGEEFVSIDATSDGGYILGGRTQSYGTFGIFDHYIVKTDSLGNQEWMRVIGSPRKDCPAGVIQTMDGNYVFCGCWNNYDASPTNPNSDPFNTLFLAKLDSSGQTIWQKEYTEPTIGAILFTVKELPDGGLISAGNRIAGKEAVLLRTDSDGNEMWMRYITHPTVVNGFKLFHDVIVEDDGGFVGTGYLVGTSSDPQPGQDLWVFRTDSMGCLVPGCHLTDNITMHANEVAVSLYPNPVQNQLSVHIKAGELPHGATIELYDMQGRQHLSTLLEPGARTYIIDMRHYASGVYLLHCTTPTEMLWTGKVVKD